MHLRKQKTFINNLENNLMQIKKKLFNNKIKRHRSFYFNSLLSITDVKFGRKFFERKLKFKLKRK